MFKKIAFVAILLASAAFARINIGEHGAFTFGTVWGEHTNESHWGAGFAAGLDFKAHVDKKLSFVAELEVDYRRMTHEYSDGHDNFDYTNFFWYLRLPAMGRFYLDQQLFGELGVTLAVRLSSGNMMEYNEDEVDSYTVVYHDDKAMNRFEVGFIAGIGFAITPKLDLNIRYAMGFIDMASKGNGASKNMRFQTGLTYWLI